jgi:hypothetical protein
MPEAILTVAGIAVLVYVVQALGRRHGPPRAKGAAGKTNPGPTTQAPDASVVPPAVPESPRESSFLGSVDGLAKDVGLSGPSVTLLVFDDSLVSAGRGRKEQRQELEGALALVAQGGLTSEEARRRLSDAV